MEVWELGVSPSWQPYVGVWGLVLGFSPKGGPYRHPLDIDGFYQIMGAYKEFYKDVFKKYVYGFRLEA